MGNHNAQRLHRSQSQKLTTAISKAECSQAVEASPTTSNPSLTRIELCSKHGIDQHAIGNRPTDIHVLHQLYRASVSEPLCHPHADDSRFVSPTQMLKFQLLGTPGWLQSWQLRMAGLWA